MGDGLTPAARSWSAVAASVRGESHERGGVPCQDAWRWGILADGSLAAVVADGAGSAALAQVGAELAAAAALAAVRGHAPTALCDAEIEAVATAAVAAARSRLEAEAAIREVALTDLGTTLLFVLATPETVAVAHVGDGAAVVLAADGTLTLPLAPQIDEYLNETTFLVSADALQRTRRAVWHGAVAQLALFSDGLQMVALKMPEGIPHAPFFTPLFRFAREVAEAGMPATAETPANPATTELAEFLRSERLKQRSDDDRTLLLASLVPPHPRRR
ncbi:MAG TPA: PP2C family serine/threonine-protein phosphatase [Thermoanaerobaculia bacterium]|nr:PP2C family serine/threonine-protein phosphatase [Thermoanaerobaculia bacterium]